MHGIGLRSSSHNQNTKDHGEHEVVGQCSPAIDYARSQKKRFSISKNVMNELTGLFGDQILKAVRIFFLTLIVRFNASSKHGLNHNRVSRISQMLPWFSSVMIDHYLVAGKWTIR
jgi:hypothetical protein